jgi:hypothetical protein
VVSFVCNFWKSPFYCRYNAEFSMCTNKIISFGLVSFVESCLQAVHSAKFDRGQREIEQPLDLRLWTNQSLRRGMLFGQISW